MAVARQSAVFTPYSTVRPLIQNMPSWVPEPDQERIGAYATYDQMYWSNPTVFRLQQRGAEYAPIYVPKAKVVVDTTSHYLLKGLRITLGDPDEYEEGDDPLGNFLKREKFYSKFHTAKHSGVARGDYVLHLTADPTKPAGSRVSMTVVDPSSWFPITDDDDQDEIIGVTLATQYIYGKPGEKPKTRIRRLDYKYDMVGGRKRVFREQAIYELDEKWFGPKARKVAEVIPYGPLPDQIDIIPVYGFKNAHWQGDQYGSSEIRGFERLLGAINQGISDEEMALALDGLGVYATDAGRPVNDAGDEVDWEISPGRVMEVPAGMYFRRVEGLNTVTPMQDHLGFLQDRLHEGTGTSDVALGQIDVQTAQSGIALAIKFMPTLAKIEQRDTEGVETLQQFWYDWRKWQLAYENESITQEIEVSIGEKLPQDRVARLNELNNMFDREIISVKFYRAEMEKLGYKFPDDIDEQIDEDNQKKAEQAAAMAPPGLADNALDAANGQKPPPPNGGMREKNRSNNRNKPNESAGTEATQDTGRQTKR